MGNIRRRALQFCDVLKMRNDGNGSRLRNRAMTPSTPSDEEPQPVNDALAQGEGDPGVNKAPTVYTLSGLYNAVKHGPATEINGEWHPDVRNLQRICGQCREKDSVTVVTVYEAFAFSVEASARQRAIAFILTMQSANSGERE
jgi:hypothetical protein